MKTPLSSAASNLVATAATTCGGCVGRHAQVINLTNCGECLWTKLWFSAS